MTRNRIAPMVGLALLLVGHTVREDEEGLDANVANLEAASAEDAQRLKREMARDLERRTERLERDEIASRRADIAQAIGALTASVRRELFEMRQAGPD